MNEEKEVFEGWCIIELMGHRRLAGYVRELNIAGAGFLRVDVPAATGDASVATQFYPPSSVYCITPTTEEIARAVAVRSNPQPVARWELPGMSVGSPSHYDVDGAALDGDDPDPTEDDNSPL